MKYQNTFLFLFLIISLASINAQTTLQDYLNNEEARLAKADSINNEVETYIINNLSTYSLSQATINEITNDLQNVHDSSSNPITGNDLNEVLNKVKRKKLRDLYFQQKPNDAIFFLPIDAPNALRQSCINGGFEDGFANYTFEERIITPSAHFDVSCSSTDNSMTAFTPNSLNNFNSRASLVSPGNEPRLASLGININRVLTGNRALKLNPTPANQAGTQIGDRTSASRNFIINENQIEFSFLQLGHIATGSHSNPYFRYRLIDNISGAILLNNCLPVNTNDCRYQQIQDNNLGNNTLSYTPNWVCQRIDTSNLIGRDVILEFSVSDCNYRGHFSTVYIDNICGVSCSPTWGNLNMDPIDIDCPTSSFDVCGDFDLPTGTSLTSMSLNILDVANNIISSINNPIINANDYCFTINPTDFGISPSGNYTFQVILNNTSGCNVLSPIIEQNGSVNFDDCSNPCDTITESTINGSILSWTSAATSFQLEFASDGNCCPSGSNDYDPPVNLSYTIVNSNSINLVNAYQDILNINSAVKCFRYKIKTDCGDWSDWCCLSISNSNPLEFENPFNECFPNSPCEDFTPLVNITDDITSGILDYDEIIDITANNTIEGGASSTYTASNSIRLLPGFHAKANCSFLAQIMDCVDIDIVTPPANSARIASENVIVYPNPAKDKVTFSIKEQKIKSYQLYNIYGKIIYSNTKTNSNSETINVGRLTRGLYILKITLEDNTIVNKNIILK